MVPGTSKSCWCGIVTVLTMLAGATATVGAQPASLQIRTYYVAVNGSVSGSGSLANPWPSVNYALSRVGGGSTILVEPGTYTVGIHVPLNCMGTQAAPTIIRSTVKWGAVIASASGDGFQSASGCNWVVLDGFQIAGAGTTGIKLSIVNNCVVRNCWVHNSTHQGISSQESNNILIENNLVENNGTNASLDHGIYANGNSLTVRNNVVRSNMDAGMQIYPSVTNSQIYNNLVYGNHLGIVLGSSGNNLIVNNTVANNLDGLMAYGPQLSDKVMNNIFTAQPGINILDGTNYTNMQMDYNLCYGGNVGRLASLSGPHGHIANPGFVAPSAGAYYLAAGSPAINAAFVSLAAPADFWDLTQPTGPISIGAFPYIPAYAEASFTNTIMDYWVMPPSH